MEGSYTVSASPSLGTATVTFTETAVKPDSVAILKDSSDIADKAPAYAVSADQPTTFFTVGVDKSGQKIGPVKCNWSLSSSGSGVTRGDGTISATTGESSTTFSPSHVGQLSLQAKASAIKGVSAGKSDLYVTSVYVALDNSFVATSPVDQRQQFVPGVDTYGNDIPVATMSGGGQQVQFHVLTGPGAKEQ